jgi:hypothetical protein
MHQKWWSHLLTTEQSIIRDMYHSTICKKSTGMPLRSDRLFQPHNVANVVVKRDAEVNRFSLVV